MVHPLIVRQVTRYYNQQWQSPLISRFVPAAVVAAVGGPIAYWMFEKVKKKGNDVYDHLTQNMFITTDPYKLDIDERHLFERKVVERKLIEILEKNLGKTGVFAYTGEKGVGKSAALRAVYKKLYDKHREEIDNGTLVMKYFDFSSEGDLLTAFKESFDIRDPNVRLGNITKTILNVLLKNAQNEDPNTKRPRRKVVLIIDSFAIAFKKRSIRRF